jgi:hypothetical protein
MTPSRARAHVWPFAALPMAGLMALVVAASGLSQGRPAAGTTDKSPPPNATASAPLIPPRQSSIDAIVAVSPYSDRQISYEVRYVRLSTEPWRELLKDRLKLVQQEADVSAWIIDKKSLADLVKCAQSESFANDNPAPKITSFENVHVTIFDEYKQSYVSRVEKVETSRVKGFRPIIKEINVGWRLDVAGSFMPDGTNVSVDVRDSNLMAMHALTRKERFGDQEVVGTYQVPSMIEHRCRVACVVPDESSLIVSLGLQINEKSNFAGVTEVASKLLGSMGFSVHKATSGTCERLVLITPRKIVLESEKQPVVVPPKVGTPTR